MQPLVGTLQQGVEARPVAEDAGAFGAHRQTQAERHQAGVSQGLQPRDLPEATSGVVLTIRRHGLGAAGTDLPAQRLDHGVDAVGLRHLQAAHSNRGCEQRSEMLDGSQGSAHSPKLPASADGDGRCSPIPRNSSRISTRRLSSSLAFEALNE